MPDQISESSTDGQSDGNLSQWKPWPPVVAQVVLLKPRGSTPSLNPPGSEFRTPFRIKLPFGRTLYVSLRRNLLG